MKLNISKRKYDTTLAYQVPKSRHLKNFYENFEEERYYADSGSRDSLGQVIVFRPKLLRYVTFYVLGGEFNNEMLKKFSPNQLERKNKHMRMWAQNHQPSLVFTKDVYVVKKRHREHNEYSIVQRCVFLNKRKFEKQIADIYGEDCDLASYVTIMLACSCCRKKKELREIIFCQKQKLYSHIQEKIKI